jgi:hypothetical protein
MEKKESCSCGGLREAFDFEKRKKKDLLRRLIWKKLTI